MRLTGLLDIAVLALLVIVTAGCGDEATIVITTPHSIIVYSTHTTANQ